GREPTSHLRVGWRAVDFALAAIRSARRAPAEHVIPTVLVKFVQFADHHVRRAPVRSPAIPLSGERRCGGKQQFVQHVAGVQFFGENLKGNAGERGRFNQLPEICRTATVVVVVTMMEGPDAIASAFEDLAAENPEAETEDDVEIMSADALDGIGREAM